MNALTILTNVAILFLAYTVYDDQKRSGRLTPARRTWLLVAAIFAAVVIGNEFLARR